SAERYRNDKTKPVPECRLHSGRHTCRAQDDLRKTNRICQNEAHDERAESHERITFPHRTHAFGLHFLDLIHIEDHKRNPLLAEEWTVPETAQHYHHDSGD